MLLLEITEAGEMAQRFIPLLKKARAWFPAPMPRILQLPVTASLGDPRQFSCLSRHLHKCAKTYTNICN